MPWSQRAGCGIEPLDGFGPNVNEHLTWLTSEALAELQCESSRRAPAVSWEQLTPGPPTQRFTQERCTSTKVTATWCVPSTSRSHWHLWTPRNRTTPRQLASLLRSRSCRP